MSEWLTQKYHANIEMLVEKEQRLNTCPIRIFINTGTMAQEAMFKVLSIMNEKGPYFEEI